MSETAAASGKNRGTQKRRVCFLIGFATLVVIFNIFLRFCPLLFFVHGLDFAFWLCYNPFEKKRRGLFPKALWIRILKSGRPTLVVFDFRGSAKTLSR